jgi:multidrug efflux pump
VLTLAITSDTLPLTEVQNLVNTRLAQKISQVSGVGLVSLAGGQKPACASRPTPRRWRPTASPSTDCARDLRRQRQQRQGQLRRPDAAYTINANDQLLTVADYSNLIVAYAQRRAGALSDVAKVVDSAENVPLGAWANETPAIIVNVQRQPGANVIDRRRHQGAAARAAPSLPASLTGRGPDRPHHRHPRLGARTSRSS